MTEILMESIKKVDLTYYIKNFLVIFQTCADICFGFFLVFDTLKPVWFNPFLLKDFCCLDRFSVYTSLPVKCIENNLIGHKAISVKKDFLCLHGLV